MPFAVMAVGLAFATLLIALAPAFVYSLLQYAALVLFVVSITAGGRHLLRLLGGRASVASVAVVVVYVVVMLPLVTLLALHVRCALGIDLL